MPEYQYQMRNANGQTAVGVLSAENAVAAAQVLRAQGNQILQLTPVSKSVKSFRDRLKALNQSSGPSARDILNFTSQLAVMIRAGISIRAAIEGIAEQTENPKFQKLLLQIKSDVESGKQFSEALAKHPKYFGALYVNMVRASEMSGSFSKMLERIAAYLSQQIETRAMVIGAMIYPAVIGTLAIAVTIFLLTFVLPKFTGVFAGKESALPLAHHISDGLKCFHGRMVVGHCSGSIGTGGCLPAGHSNRHWRPLVRQIQTHVPHFQKDVSCSLHQPFHANHG